MLAVAAAGVLAVAGSAGLGTAHGATPSPTDIYAGIGKGKIQHLNSSGAQVAILDTTTNTREVTGMCWDASGNLHSTEANFDATDPIPGSVSKFNSQGTLVAATWATGFNTHPNSCTWDKAGNAYVGEVDPATGTPGSLIRKFDANGNQLATYSEAAQFRGANWIDLAADQCTIYYTSEGDQVKRFNVCTNTQLPDFTSGLDFDNGSGTCYGVRVRRNGEVMVTCSAESYRLSAAGIVLQTYPIDAAIANSSYLYAMNLDHDETSFWTSSYLTGDIYRYDIASGNLLQHFTASPQDGFMSGLTVSSEFRAATAPPPPVTDTTPPTCKVVKQAKNAQGHTYLNVLFTDTGSGLASLVVTQNTNFDIPIPSFTAGTQQVTITATVVNQSNGAEATIRAIDVAGNIYDCDPLMATLTSKSAGIVNYQSFSGIMQKENQISIANGTPGLTMITVLVNNVPISVLHLKPGQSTTLDATRFMRPGKNNAVAFAFQGAANASADIMVCMK
jgi:sugar lactone lactonase YvrE